MSTIQKLLAAQAEDTNALIERAPHVGIIYRCLVARVHPFFPGEPGVAKSMMLRLMGAHFSDDGGFRYFEQQVFADTKTEVLFGPYSMQALDQDRFQRVTTGRLPEAHVAFIDELFDASAGTLNTLRPVLAEKLFYNPEPTPIPLIMFCAAGNHYPAPDREDLQALFDRLGVVMPVKAIQSGDGFREMLRGQFTRRRTAAQGNTTQISLAELADVHAACDAVTETDEYLDAAVQLWQACMDAGLTNVSARRWGEIGRLAQTEALFAGRDYLMPEDLRVAMHSLWKQPQDERTAYEVTLPFLSQFEKDVGGLIDSYEEQAETMREIRRQHAEDTKGSDWFEQANNTNLYLKRIKESATSKLQDGIDAGRDTRELTELIDRIQGDRAWVFKNALGLDVVPD